MLFTNSKLADLLSKCRRCNQLLLRGRCYHLQAFCAGPELLPMALPYLIPPCLTGDGLTQHVDVFCRGCGRPSVSAGSLTAGVFFARLVIGAWDLLEFQLAWPFTCVSHWIFVCLLAWTRCISVGAFDVCWSSGPVVVVTGLG